MVRVCLEEEFRRNEEYERRAYEQMTDEEILMSERRYRSGEATYDFLERYRKFKEDSRKVRVIARQRAVA